MTLIHAVLGTVLSGLVLSALNWLRKQLAQAYPIYRYHRGYECNGIHTNSLGDPVRSVSRRWPGPWWQVARLAWRQRNDTATRELVDLRRTQDLL